MNETRSQDDPIQRVRKQMQIITADGRCAGYVSEWTANQICMATSTLTIPREWIRRVDRDVYISKRLYELAQ